MKKYLFSYGTLQRENVQLELFGRILRGTRDVLVGYTLKPILLKSEKHYNVIATPGKDSSDTIIGTALEITPGELPTSDKYEPEEYKRVKLKLQSGKEAWVYVAA